MMFSDSGFLHEKNFFEPQALSRMERAVTSLYERAAFKIGKYRNDLEFKTEDDAVKLSYICKLLEADDKEALYQVQHMMPSSQEVRAIYDDRFLELCGGLLKADPRTLLIDGPGLLINARQTDRLLYRWHSGAHYYPKRRRFLNVWFPLFYDKPADSGVMSVKLGSHKQHWDFAEYSKGKNAFRQFEVPANFHAQYPEHLCVSKRGDLIVFDRNLVHRSNPNVGKEFSFACVTRVWLPDDDLTIAGKLDVTPYGNDVGREGLVVNP